MASFSKDVLYPGTYWVSDGKGGKKAVTYSRQDVAALSQRMQEMIDAGLSIPLAAEHQDQGKPLTQEEKKAAWVKQLTMGWAEEAELTPEGFLTARVAVPVEEDARRIPANRFVSPEIIQDFVDGTGRLWPGPSITHLAVTPRPVHAAQKPFQPVQMSEVIRLSLEDFQGVRMSEEEKLKEEPKEEKPKEEAKEEKPKEVKQPSGDVAGLDLPGLRVGLEGDGYAIPGHVNDPIEFLKHLHTAMLSKKAMIDKLLAEVEEEEVQEQPQEGVSGSDQLPQGVSPENGPVLMSLGGHKFTIIRQARPKEKIPMSQGNNDRFEKALLAREKKDLSTRISTLFQSGRITKPIHDKLVQDMSTVRMSLADTGELESNAVLAKVEAYEALPAGSAWPNDGTLPEGVSPAPEAQGWSGYESREQVQSAVEDFFALTPSGATKK